jgi:hypothetical protein
MALAGVLHGQRKSDLAESDDPYPHATTSRPQAIAMAFDETSANGS